MRIVQLIDTLNIGGAEKMAVNYANSLNDKIYFSGIVATRVQGSLVDEIKNKNNYLFLSKKNVLDFKAIVKLKKYCKKNKVEYIHAHGTSFFTAFLLKIIYFKIKIIWHEHYGATVNKKMYQILLIWFCSKFFNKIIVVNKNLENWCKTKLKFNNVLYLPNFIDLEKSILKETILSGIDHKRILILANLKKPKNHNLLIEVAIEVIKKHQDWSFHLIGKDFIDDYSQELKTKIIENKLQDNIFLYDLKKDINNILTQSEICVLTSDSEGLPVAFLEYGFAKKPIVTTAVGELIDVIEHEKNGFLVPVNNPILFANSVCKLIEEPNLRIDFGKEIHKKLSENYSEVSIINQYLNWIINSKK